MTTCPSCGAVLGPGSQQCTVCGALITTPPPPPPPPATMAPPPAGAGPAVPPPPPAGANKGLLVGIGIAVLVAAGGVGAWLLLRGDGQQATAAGSAAVSSDSSGTITSPGGATINIPVGAVPLTEQGDTGQIVFTIDEQAIDGASADLPEGLALGNTVYHIGPDFQTLTAPATLTLPIPEDVDPALVGGLAWYEEAASQWRMVPARVNAGAHTVSTEVTHFSDWALWYEKDEEDRRWKAENGGYIEVSNLISYSPTFPTDFFGWGDYRSSYTSYGVCVEQYRVDDPAVADRWWQPYEWMIMQRAFPGSDFEAPQEGTYSFWMPQGEYVLTEVIYISEMNRSTGYVPAYGWAWRPIGTVMITPGSTISYSEEQRVEYPLENGGWTAGRPDCAGEEMHSPGYGDVQITLTWPQDGIDLDLHVTDPDGFEIYFDDEVSPSGGWLDDDNLQGGGIPENVFWVQAPSGHYVVEVVYFSGSEPANWTVRTIVQGQVQVFTGTISPAPTGEDRTRVLVDEFNVG